MSRRSGALLPLLQYAAAALRGSPESVQQQLLHSLQSPFRSSPAQLTKICIPQSGGPLRPLHSAAVATAKRPDAAASALCSGPACSAQQRRGFWRGLGASDMAAADQHCEADASAGGSAASGGGGSSGGGRLPMHWRGGASPGDAAQARLLQPQTRLQEPANAAASALTAAGARQGATSGEQLGAAFPQLQSAACVHSRCFTFLQPLSSCLYACRRWRN